MMLYYLKMGVLLPSSVIVVTFVLVCRGKRPTWLMFLRYSYSTLNEYSFYKSFILGYATP